MPKAWVAKQGNLVWYKQHTKVSAIIPHSKYSPRIPSRYLGVKYLTHVVVIQGGHFAALEQPELIIQDVEEFVQQVWPVK